jgi:hypothetical protein
LDHKGHLSFNVDDAGGQTVLVVVNVLAFRRRASLFAQDLVQPADDPPSCSNKHYKMDSCCTIWHIYIQQHNGRARSILYIRVYTLHTCIWL